MKMSFQEFQKLRRYETSAKHHDKLLADHHEFTYEPLKMRLLFHINSARLYDMYTQREWKLSNLEEAEKFLYNQAIAAGEIDPPRCLDDFLLTRRWTAGGMRYDDKYYIRYNNDEGQWVTQLADGSAYRRRELDEVEHWLFKKVEGGAA